MKKKLFCRFLSLLLVAAMLTVPVSAAEDDVVIVLDPGHGGMDSGVCVTYDGVQVWESTLNLKIAQYCRDYLKRNYQNVQVYLTRETDVKMSLETRINYAVNRGADYLLSIHINSADGSARGAQAIVPRGKYNPAQGKASLRTAEAILRRMKSLGLRMLDGGTTYRLGTGTYPDGNQADYFAIVRGGVINNIPAIIMEHAFLDNESDYRNFLSTEEQLAALGRADALGLAESLGLKTRLPFSDVPGSAWYSDAVRYVWNQGFMEGISDTEFGPAMPANRAMVVTLLYRLDGAKLEPKGSSFTDVEPGSWYHAPVEWALKNGITNGVSKTEFAPNRNVIREQFVTFLHRYAGEPKPKALPTHFSDWKNVSGYAQNAVAWAVEEGLLTGYDNGTIRPLQELNRAELATLVQRFHKWLLQKQEEEKVTWTISHTDVTIKVGESFYLKLKSSEGETATVTWTASKSGYVTISGNKITGKAKGTITVSCEHEGQTYSCIVRVKNS